MTNLAWANIKHRKLRSILAGLGVTIGISSLITMLALSHGTLNEVAKRVQGIDADLIVLPAKSSLIFSEGAPLSNKYIPKIQSVTIDSIPIVKRVVEVYLSVMPSMAGQQQRVFAIDRSDFNIFAKGRKIKAGRLFDPNDEFKNYILKLRARNGKNYHPDEVPDKVLNRACELVIDDRLARAGHYKIGDKIPFAGRTFTICGIVQAGGAGRVFAPIQVMRHIQNAGLPWSSLFFVKLAKTKFTHKQCAKAIKRAIHLRVEALDQYDKLLFDSFRSIYIYINCASLLILIVSFLFIMVTIYTIILERKREIGILRAMGAGGWYIMKQTILEAMIISVGGTVLGIAISYLAKWGIESYRPLLTVDLQIRWVLLAIVVGLTGGLISALYPGYQALKQDPIEALTYE